MPFEVAIIRSLQEFILSSSWITLSAIFFARWFIFFDAIPAYVLLRSKNKADQHAVLEALWSFGVAITLTTIIAMFVSRLRPFAAQAEILRLIPVPFNSSFPSGHTGSAFAIASALLYHHRQAGVFAMMVAACVALSRIAVGVHYPTDILGGIVVGVVSFAVVRIFHAQLRRRDIARSVATHRHDV